MMVRAYAGINVQLGLIEPRPPTVEIGRSRALIPRQRASSELLIRSYLAVTIGHGSN